MNDARPVDLDVLARRLRPRRRAHAAVLGRDLVPDGLRHARPRQGGVRHPEAPAPDGPLPPVHRAGRRHLGDPVRRAAVLPRSRAARPQRRPRRPGQHLPRPGGLPRPDAHPRPRRRTADDSRLDRGFHWLATEFADPPGARRRGRGDLHHGQGRLHRGLRPADGAGAGRREGRAGHPRRASRCSSRCGRVFEPIMLQSDQICDGIGYPVELRHRAPRPSCSTSRNVLCANRFRTRSSATASRSRPSWCAPCCATTNPTGSTPSSCRPGSRPGGSAATTNTSTRSSSA